MQTLPVGNRAVVEKTLFFVDYLCLFPKKLNNLENENSLKITKL